MNDQGPKLVPESGEACTPGGFTLKLDLLHHTPILPSLAKLDMWLKTTKHNVPAKMSWNVMRMMRKLDSLVKNELQPSYLALVKKYAELDEKGELKPVMSEEVKDKDGKVIKPAAPTGHIHLKKETQDEFHEKAKEFFEVESPVIESQKIDFKVFDELTEVPKNELAQVMEALIPIIQE